MNNELSRKMLIEILGGIPEEKKREVEDFCIRYSSEESFEEAWKTSRELLKKNPYYFNEIKEEDTEY